VAAGTLLVSLADEDIQSGLKAAEAALASADAQHRRVENLMKTGASMAAEQDMARTQLAQAKAALAQVQASIAYTQIRSPFAGVVQARRVNDGDFVGPGTPLVEIEGQGAFELLGSISEEEAMNLKMGMRLPFETEGRAGEALITGLSSGGDPITHRGTIRARVVRSDGAMRSGTFARIKLPGAVPVKAEAAPSVPLSALVVRGELNGVFVAREGRAELRWLSLGERQGDRVLVRAGLAKGEAVIDTPGGLRDGQPVEVMR
jgi:RND family efflux transporter MFP subunit